MRLHVSLIVPWGAPQHYFKPRLRERGDRHPPALPVPIARHRGAGWGCQVEGAPRHHRVHAPVGGAVGESGNSWSVIKPERLELSGHERSSNGSICVHRAWSSLMRSSTPSAWPGWLTTVSLLCRVWTSSKHTAFPSIKECFAPVQSYNVTKAQLFYWPCFPLHLLNICHIWLHILLTSMGVLLVFPVLEQHSVRCSLSGLLAEWVWLVVLMS